MRAIAVCFVVLVGLILFAQHRGSAADQTSPTVSAAPSGWGAAADNAGNEGAVTDYIARDIAATVKSGESDRQMVEAAQAAGSPSLLAYEKLVDLRMRVNAIAKEAATCGIRSRSWQNAVDTRADEEMRNGDLPSDLMSKMTIDEVFAADAYGNYMKPFHNVEEAPTPKDCSSIFGAEMTATGPREFFANKVDRYGRGEGLLFERID